MSDDRLSLARALSALLDAEGNRTGLLLTFQDLTEIKTLRDQAEQAQRLAVLGRLATGLAHEIRNPLGAISHAGQLLAESDNLDKNDKRLTQIISDHSQRLFARGNYYQWKYSWKSSRII